MRLYQLNESHFEDLFDFEIRNKDWFELFVPPRPEDYKSIYGFSRATACLLQEQNKGESYFFVGVQDGKIIVRANLVGIDNGSADVGYRVCGQEAGKGYATNALEALIDFALNSLGLEQLTAKTTNNNLASIRVLQKVGFDEVATDTKTFEMNGKNVSFVHFIKQLR